MEHYKEIKTKGIVFKDRKECLAKVKETEKHKKKNVSQETYYEEY